MAITTNFNTDPYYDDFDENKNFHRILYKPGYAVQARELTQSQTLLQDQIKKFGDHIFKSGSVVTGGQVFVQNTAYINIASTYSGSSITANNFNQKYIVNATGTKKAYVLKAYEADAVASEPITFIINQLYGSDFSVDETILTANTESGGIDYYANVASSNPVGNSKAFSVNEGVFYYEGYFVKNRPQSVAVSKYDRNGTAIIGFEITEDVVDYTEDTSLLDPAQDSSNFQAPGADRFRITLTLSTRAVDSTDFSKFIEISQFEEGVLKKVIQTPIYANFGDELARRTFDESGDYIVRPFDIALTDTTGNTAQANVTIGPGKAYIKGYEFGTIAPTTLTINKPRTTESVNNRRINADYGYYVLANNVFGTFPTNLITNAELYVVDKGTLQGGFDSVTPNTSVRANVKAGTARVKLLSLDSSANSADSNTYIYKVFLTDLNVSPIWDSTNGNGYNVISTTSNSTTFTLPTQFANTSASNNYAYVGATIRMLAGPCRGESRTIIYYDGVARNVTVQPAFSRSIINDSKFVIDTKIDDVDSIIIFSGDNIIASANINDGSRRLGVVHKPTYIQEDSSEPLLLKVGENNVADNTIADFSYTYRRLYQSVQFTSNVSTALSLGAGEDLQSASSTSAKQQYYTIIVTAKGTSPNPGLWDVRTHVPATQITDVSTSSRTITVNGAENMVANVIATINASNPTSKSKTFVRANTQYVDPTAGRSNSIFDVSAVAGTGNASVFVSSLDGQVQIANTGLIVKTPGTDQTLYVSDVHSINAIFDFGAAGYSTINQANYTALDKSEGSAANVTSRYIVRTGQKDSYYDWGAIRLKAGQTAPKGPLLIRFNRFKSTGTGYFDVSSYTRLGQNVGEGGIAYGEIPTFAAENGALYSLKDYLDFRPVRKDATDTYTANNVVFDVEERGIGPKIVEKGTAIVLDYSYYLPRVDRVVLNRIGTFEVVAGVASTTPVAPAEPAESMTLYILTYPAYLSYASQASIQTFVNKRYTMKDIGNLEKRIQNLEYYTSLSLLEQATLNKQDLYIRDNNGLVRTKNGMMVDSFVDKTVASFNARDFSAAIDVVNNLVRNSYNLTSVRAFSNASPSDVNVEYNGPLLTLASTEETFLSQNLASKSINVNPFNVINYIGKINLDPQSDVYTSDARIEAQNIDLTGGDAARDAWSSIQSTSWGAWKTTWTGVSLQEVGAAEKTTVRQQVGTGRFNQRTGQEITRLADVTTTTQDYLETRTTQETRTGILSQIVPQQLTRSLGDRLVDVSVVQFMRAVNIVVTGQSFKPSSTLYTFFDNVNVDDKVARINQFQLANNNLQFKSTVSDPEEVIFRANSASGTEMGRGFSIVTSNNNAFIAPATLTLSASYGTWANATNIYAVGSTTGTIERVNNYYHYCGRATTANATSITFSNDAGSAFNHANTDYVGQTIRIVNGTGKGISATIATYNVSTRVATITGTWSTTPDSTSVYSIGNLTTTPEGSVAGVFLVPDGIFRTGEKLFRMLDESTGSVERSTTSGDASFFSSGLIQTKQETTVSVFVPGVVRSVVSESRTSSVSSIRTATVGQTIRYVDPLAQTFLINPVQYPQGIMLSSVRVCFKTKDTQAPVTLQVRPVINGYPSSSVVYPFAEVVLTPDKVKTSTIPNLTDSNKYTEFTFDVPVYILPGEHCFVLLSNSVGYEAYIAEIGAVNLGNNAKISEQPYTGSLFLSQNGSTWTADQTSDMMFSLHKKVYDNNIGYGFFEVDMAAQSSNVVFDLMHVMTTDVVMANTSLTYEFASEGSDGTTHSYLPFVPNFDYKMTDGYGRRTLNKTVGNSTFTIRTTMQSSNRDISPMLDITRVNLLAIENKINDLPLREEDFVIENAGSGYASNTNLTITGGGGTGAAAYANVTSAGIIDKIVVTAGGTGYYSSPTIGISGTGTVSYNGEDKKEGGNSLVRYLTRKVQLAPGFTSNDLRVYLNLYKPGLSNIYVYGKYLSPTDPGIFEDKNWNLLTQIGGGDFISENDNDYRELVFAPGSSGVASGIINYTSGTTPYTDFAIFAVKIVLSGQSTVDVPKVKELRIIALPSA